MTKVGTVVSGAGGDCAAQKPCDFCDLGFDEELCLALAPAPVVDFQHSGDSRRSICLTEPRMDKQTFLGGCVVDVRASAKHFKNRGPGAWMVFCTLRRLGGESLRHAVPVVKAKCAAFGKGHQRLTFNWGTKCVWMSRGLLWK